MQVTMNVHVQVKFNSVVGLFVGQNRIDFNMIRMGTVMSVLAGITKSRRTSISKSQKRANEVVMFSGTILNYLKQMSLSILFIHRFFLHKTWKIPHSNITTFR